MLELYIMIKNYFINLMDYIYYSVGKALFKNKMPWV